ncbi:hypothetical protein [Aliiroseovarius sp. 2305UL8-7]
MNAIVSPVVPLANAIADVIIHTQSAVRRFVASDSVPTWTEYMKSYNR